MDNFQYLKEGDQIHFGDWDFGWESTADILGLTPKKRFYRIKIHGAQKASLQSVKEVHQGYYISYKGCCPIKIL